ncbi:hypothetical protein JR316_0006229 [Psilocybe cubensis]|uniref:Uncharacterized protein n=1 Tax=Psilocybe cubensis TaxID=181762 RepID=A0ACB8H1Y4_PSICU|nr:hypothetical protein JR316_0006229 [Psilocybe cubensis]KAH9481702.1 hypothetical protein JR316_0006229 [Psilocybe cubensis]
MSAVHSNVDLGSLPPSYTLPIAPGESTTSDDAFPSLQPSNLPAYTPPSRRTNSAPTAQGELRQSMPKEFYYDLKRRGKVFASLTLIAEGTYSKHMPTFLEGQPITGRVKLSFDKPDALQSVIVSIRGQVIMGANRGEQMTFIEISHTLWSPATGGEQMSINSNHSNAPATQEQAPAASSLNSSQPSKVKGKLQGDYMWPFSIELPNQVVWGGKTFSLPQTFYERHARASITYEVSLQLSRGKLRADHRIPAACGYIPQSRPPPFPLMRALAYQEGLPLFGPTIDPDGWFSCEPVVIRGKVFNSRNSQIKSTLSYTRGSVIPLCLRLESMDEQVLDLLSSPKAIVARLERRIRYFSNAENNLESWAGKDGVDISQPAVWWPSAEESHRSGQLRFVNGELHLRADFKPTSAVAQFRIQYSVVLFPFESPGVVLMERKPLIQHPVEIVTAYALGPKPRITAPSGYLSEAPVLTPTNTISTADIGLL